VWLRTLKDHGIGYGVSRVMGFILAFVALSFMASLGWAQSLPTSSFISPDVTPEQIESRLATIETDSTLSESDKQKTQTYYGQALQSLSRAAMFYEAAESFKIGFSSAEVTLERLTQELEDIRSQPISAKDSDIGMTHTRLFEIQRDLISKESELRNLRSDSARFEAELQTLITRPVAAREELALAQEDRNQLQDQLTSLPANGGGNIVGTALKVSLQSQLYAKMSEIEALEQELPGLSAQQQIVTARNDLTLLKAQSVEQEVIALQNQTGERRVKEAKKRNQESLSALQIFLGAHPLVLASAEENLQLTQALEALALTGSNFPKEEASKRRQLSDIEAGLATAQELIDLGNLGRQSSATLRRVRRQTPSLGILRTEFKKIQQNVNAAIQSRLLLQDKLRTFPLGPLDVQERYTKWQSQNPEKSPLSSTDIVALNSLHDQQRALLTELSEAASISATSAASLQTLQSELVLKTQTLTETLDRNLLWLPSVDPISRHWPLKVWRGFGQVFSLENLTAVRRYLALQIKDYFFLILLGLSGIALIGFMRERMFEDVKIRAQKIGKVKQDNFWHTPMTILVCGLRALPVPLMIMLVFILMALGTNTNPFIESLRDAFLYLALFVLFFNFLRECNRDASLFDAHFNLPQSIRQSLNKNLKWLEPSMAVTIGLIILARDSRSENIYGGVGVFSFIILGTLLTIFFYKALWQHKDIFAKVLPKDSFVRRYDNPIFALLIGLPILGIILASFGYFDTATELMERMFLSSQLGVLAYISYGLIRRTVNILQRRVSLRQAIERREKLVRARKDRVDAEGQGQQPLPQIDYEQIDVETLSRQTTQLLLTLVVIGFSVLMWVVWRDLLPALGVFDEVKIWGQDDVNVTLWDLMQWAIILIFTVIAGKNLPGFLEIFLLNRTSLETGTKYAIRTILGYVIVVLGMLLAFDQLGTKWSQLQWIVAALGVGIGFGLQEIIANFISGLIILFERPVRVGDYISIGDQSGTVGRIQIRATTLTDLDNREILIPNKELITGRVMNWTLSNATTRLIIPLGIAYGSDTDMARDIMLSVLTDNPNVLTVPAPQVLFVGFGDSSLDFELRIFLKSFEERWPVRHALHMDLNKALNRAGISIPFPQRDLNIVAQPGVFAPDSKADKMQKLPPLKTASKKTKPAKPKLRKT